VDWWIGYTRKPAYLWCTFKEIAILARIGLLKQLWHRFTRLNIQTG